MHFYTLGQNGPETVSFLETEDADVSTLRVVIASFVRDMFLPVFLDGADINIVDPEECRTKVLSFMPLSVCLTYSTTVPRRPRKIARASWFIHSSRSRFERIQLEDELKKHKRKPQNFCFYI